MGRKFIETEGLEFELFPEGTSAVILAGMHFVGLQQHEYSGERTVCEDVVLEWVAGGAGSEGQDLAICESLRVSFHPKSTLHNRMRAILGGDPPQGLDLASLLGRGALITVAHEIGNRGMKAKITGATALPRGMKPPAWEGATSYSDINDPAAQPDLEAAPALVVWKLEHRVTGAPPPAAAPRRPAPQRAAPPADFADSDIPW